MHKILVHNQCKLHNIEPSVTPGEESPVTVRRNNQQLLLGETIANNFLGEKQSPATYGRNSHR